MNKAGTGSAFIMFFIMLTTLFTAFKIKGLIIWSWFWVLSPVLIPLLISIVVVLSCAIVITIIEKELYK